MDSPSRSLSPRLMFFVRTAPPARQIQGRWRGAFDGTRHPVRTAPLHAVGLTQPWRSGPVQPRRSGQWSHSLRAPLPASFWSALGRRSMWRSTGRPTSALTSCAILRSEHGRRRLPRTAARYVPDVIRAGAGAVTVLWNGRMRVPIQVCSRTHGGFGGRDISDGTLRTSCRPHVESGCLG